MFRGKIHKRKALTGYLFLSPGIILLLTFTVIPIFYSFYISFFRWNMLKPLSQAKFMGLQNYQHILADETFRTSFINTLKYSAGMVFFIMVFSLVLAVTLNSSIKLKGLFRTVYFIPVVTTMVAVAIVWTYLYHPTYGMFNSLLNMLGIKSMGFLKSTSQSLYSVMFVNVWKRTGYYMIILLAGLQAIPKNLYEAAKVDGANKVQQFFKVTIPMLKPTLLLTIIMATIEALKVFTPIFVMTKGGPADSSLVTVVHIYLTAFNYFRMGRASAMAIIMFALIFVITMLQMKILNTGSSDAY